MVRRHEGRAVVVGGSLAGLFAARVLSERFDEVVIVERDDLEHAVDGRKGVPQSRHAHALLEAGRQRIASWFPGLEQELIDGGAAALDQGADVFWHQGGARRATFEVGHLAAVCSRPFLEEAVRARVEKLPNVELRAGASVEGLHATNNRSRVTGVYLSDGTDLNAALVLDCTGRVGRSLAWIEGLGYDAPQTVNVGMDMRYTSRVFRRDPNGAHPPLSIIIGERLGVAFPMEGNRYMVTLAGYHGDQAPSEDEGFLAFARGLPSPEVADIIEQCEPLSDYRTHRMTSNQKRLAHKLKRAPAGWALLGDAIASFNPIYGQGMSSAALQAEALGVALDGHDAIDEAMTTAIHKGAAKAIVNAWALSTGGDFNDPRTTGKRPPGTKLINRYVDRAVRAGHTDVVVAKQFVAVGNLMAPGPSLLAPKYLWRVLAHGRRR